MRAQSKEEVLGALLEDMMSLLEDLLQSGFDTVHDSTLEELQKMEELTKQYGMTYLSDLLQKLIEGLNNRRHQITRQEDNLVEVYTTLNEYLYLCLEKTAYDKGRNYYEEAE